MNEKKAKTIMISAADQCVKNIYRRTLNMLPMPCLPWQAMLHGCLTEEDIEASRRVVRFNEPEKDAFLTLAVTYGIGWVEAMAKQPDEGRIHLPTKNKDSNISVNLMEEEPPPFAHAFCHWVRHTTDVHIDCLNFIRTIDAMKQLFTLPDIKLLWPDMPLMVEVTLKDSYTTQAQREFVSLFRETPLPKRPMMALWPGLREDIERCRAAVGRALLADIEPKQREPLPGEVKPTIYRRTIDAVMTEQVTVNKRAGVTPERYYHIM